MSAVDAFLEALLDDGSGARRAAPGQALLTSLDGLPVTVAWRRGDAIALATRRATTLVDVEPPPTASPVSPTSAVAVAVARVGGAAVARDAADLGIVLDGDPAGAAAQVRAFLRQVAERGPARAPSRVGGLTDVVPFALDGPYDLDAVLDAIFDGGAARFELHDGATGREVVTALARLDGVGVGVVANRASEQRGALTPDGCRRIARLVSFCAAHHRPVVFLVDSAGLRPGTPADLVGLHALRQALSTVVAAPPLKLVVILGRAYGLAATLTGAVGARADFVCTWPRAEIGFTEPHGEDERAAASVMAAARRGELLEVIEPDRTRQVLVELLHVAAGERRFNVG